MPLISEATGYDFKGKTPAGRCILENRSNTGKLSLWVQDLKPETKYSIYIIFAEARQHVGFLMGQLDVDGKGKAEFRRDISSGDVHNFMLKEVVSVAVIATNATGVVSPLCGYNDAQVSWRHTFRVWKKAEPVLAAEELPPELPISEDSVAAKPEKLHEELIPNPVEEDVVLPHEAVTPVHEEVVPINDDEVEPLFQDPEPVQVISPPLATRPSTAMSPKNLGQSDTIQLLESIFNANTPCKPFTNQACNVKWVRCNQAEQMPLPSNRPHLMSEPFMLAAWADHEHFILGIAADCNPPQYVIGIPGTYTPEGNVAAERLGFTEFKCPKKDPPSTGDDGYWLMSINLL